MLRSILVRVLAVVICLALVTSLIAAEGVIISYEKGQLEVKIGDKVEKVKLGKDTKVLDKDGGEVKGKDRGKALTKDVKVDIKKDGDKIVEIKILK